MLQLVLLLSALAAAVYGGVLSQFNERIIGGDRTTIENYPYQLSLEHLGSHICGASIISPTVAITAAHCTDGSLVSVLRVRAGSSVRGSGGQVVRVQKLEQHPSYNTYLIDYDISVLILASPLTFGPGVQPIQLAEDNQEVPAGLNAIVTGWGEPAVTQLQVVEVPIVSEADCKDAHGASSITERMICAGTGGKDACGKDGGGPLVVDGVQVGIISWGFGCGYPEYPRIYASVPKLRGFIRKVSGV